eukprot:2839605-Rhodomonas_salina.2
MSMIKYFEKTPMTQTIPMFGDIGIDVDDEGNADYTLQEFSRSICDLPCVLDLVKLDLAVPPGVAFMADEIQDVAYQAFNKGMAMAAAQLSSCWNCGDQ